MFIRGNCGWGNVVERMGGVVRGCWLATPGSFSPCLLEEFVVMPNHGIGIVVWNGVVTKMQE